MEQTQQAIGIVECRGITASIEAADNMIKTADVAVLGTQKIGNALIFIVVTGSVDAVKEAVAAGSRTAKELGELFAARVLPRPSEEIFRIITMMTK